MNKSRSLFPLLWLALLAASYGCVEIVGMTSPSEHPLVVEARQTAQPYDTKAPVVGTTFPTSNPIVLSAYSSATAATFFTQIPFAYDDAAAGWKSVPAKYWPQTGTLDFLAYSCPGLNPTVTYASDASAGITSFVTGDNRTAQADLMFGAAAGCSYSEAALPTLGFKHAMSLVTFTAACPDVAYDAATNTGITIESIVLSTASYGGTCAVTRSGGEIGTITWPALANQYDGVSVPGVSSQGLTLSQVAVGDGIVLPPQAAVNFTVNYTAHSGATNTSLSYTFTNSGTWDMGKRYTYALEVSFGFDVNVTATVDTWSAVSDIALTEPTVSRQYDYGVFVTPETASITYNGNTTLSATLKQRSKLVVNGVDPGWGDWSAVSGSFSYTWSKGSSTYASVNSSGKVTGSNQGATDQDVTITASVTYKGTSYSGTSTVTVGHCTAAVTPTSGNLYIIYTDGSYSWYNTKLSGKTAIGMAYKTASGVVVFHAQTVSVSFSNIASLSNDGPSTSPFVNGHAARLASKPEMQYLIAHKTEATTAMRLLLNNNSVSFPSGTSKYSTSTGDGNTSQSGVYAYYQIWSSSGGWTNQNRGSISNTLGFLVYK